MRHQMLLAALLAATFAPFATAQVGGTTGAKAKASTEAIVAQLDRLASNLGHDDPRIRYAVREGFRALGTLGIGSLNNAKSKATAPHVRDFITRVIKSIRDQRQRTAQRGNRGRGGGRGGRTNRGRTVDIDLVAMEANLTWDEMAKVLPLLKKVRTQSSDIMRDAMGEGREGWRAMRDEATRKDLTAAFDEYSKEAETALLKILSPEKMKRVKRHLNPMGNMMRQMERWGANNRNRDRGGRGGRGGDNGNRGGRG